MKIVQLRPSKGIRTNTSTSQSQKLGVLDVVFNTKHTLFALCDHATISCHLVNNNALSLIILHHACSLSAAFSAPSHR